MSFQDTGLDPRILRALSKQGLTAPTPVQAAAIPAALQGKDIVARARTGSGKTLAYLLPALQRIVGSSNSRQPWQVLVLVPTRELCDQVAAEGRSVAKHCGVPISITTLLGDTPVAQRAAAAAAGALVVTTPARIAAALREGWVQPAALAKSLQVCVLDEADLLLSYGYSEDLQALAVHIPRSTQVLLLSATSSSEVEALQQLVLHNPVSLNLLAAGTAAAAAGTAAAAGGQSTEAGADGTGAAGGGGVLGAGAASEIVHYGYSCTAVDRRLVVLALLKLGLLRKKVLIFTNSVDEGVGLRLFLESFGLRLGCLHAELPVNSRSHILGAFNKGLFDFLIAVDDVHARDRPAAAAAVKGRKRKRKQGEGDEQQQQQQQQQQQKGRKDEEFGVTRGIDFKGVRSVINYDLPDSLQGYVHRVGRTGRAGLSGLALTLLTPADEAFRQTLTDALAAGSQQQQQQGSAAAATGGSDSDSDSESDDGLGGGGERGSKRQREAQQGLVGLRPFSRLSPASLEALRYRGEDVGRTITKGAVREARARELQRELLNSEKLAEYFEEHEAERMLLRHDKPMHRKSGHIPHLRHLPAYLRDPAAIDVNQLAAAGAAAAAAAQRQPKQKGPKPKRQKASAAAADPLKAVSGGAGGTGAAAAGGGGGGGSNAGAGGSGPAGNAAAAAAAAAVAGRGVSGGGGVFVKASRKSGAAADEELTELERKAMANPLKLSKAKLLAGMGGAALQAKVLGTKAAAQAKAAQQGAGAGGGGKRNVRAVRPKMGAGAKRRR